MTRGVDEATATATAGEVGAQPVHRISVNVSSLSHVFLLPTKKGCNNPPPTESL